MERLDIDTSLTALLVMDVQNDQYGLVEKAGQAGPLLDTLCDTIHGARQAGMPVIYVVVQYRIGYPEAHPRNRFQVFNKEKNRLQEGSEEAQIHSDVAPEPGDIIVTKRRVNAFFNTDLDTVLRSLGIETIVLTGIATRGVILSTTRHAADADYEIVILEDGCADPDPEIHDFLIRKILPWQATIGTAKSFIRAVERRS
ncbi:MAG: cysteine hydrolase [Candidatus Hydrogenedentes bacterium]|nr:cysteine hydrolase [Candidatus Hydrogenedentota bacterium]